METKYDEIMDKIQVTEEMRARILKNISGLNIDMEKNKIKNINHYKRYLSIAACVVILFGGFLVLRDRIDFNKDPQVGVEDSLVAHNSLKDLSKALGYEIKDIGYIPFEVENIKYTSYWGELGEIEYIGSENRLVYRISDKGDDISGEYLEFSDIISKDLSGVQVTFKGEGGRYKLANFSDGNYVYSMSFDDMVSEEDFIKVVESLKEF